MAQIGSSKVWHIYANDVPYTVTLHGVTPGAVNAPEHSPVFLRHAVWRTDPDTATGDTITLRDKHDHDVFQHTREADDVGAISRDLCGEPYYGLKLVNMTAGVLDLYIE